MAQIQLTLSDLQEPVSRDSVLETIFQLLTAANFPVDSWQDEGAARSFVEVQAHLTSVQSQSVAQLARMVFLATAVGGFLDALVESHFDLTRNPAVAARFDVTLVNTGAATHPVTPGSILLRASNGQMFQSNENATVSANAETVVEFIAQIAGGAGNVPPQDLELVTPLAGVTAEYGGALIVAGADLESDTKLRERALAQWGLLRIEKVDLGLIALARGAASGVHGVSIDSENPRGPGTVDVYLASQNGTIGGGDLVQVQLALDDALFGTGSEEQAGLAVSAPLQTVNLSANVYVRGALPEEVSDRLAAAWAEFLIEIPLGGFDLSPGPTNVIQRTQIVPELIRRAYPDGASPIVAIDIVTPAADVNVGLHTKVVGGSVAFNVVPLA
jgi:uncharacterized phage protein gp47/JayE